MNMRARLAILLGMSALVLLVAAWSAPPSDGDIETRLAALSGRISTVEKILGASTEAVSTPSALRRISRLEDALGELSRAAGKPKWSSPDSNIRELRRTIEAQQRTARDLSVRLDALERSTRGRSGDGRDVRELRSSIERLRTAISDLDRRVDRLERK